MSRPFAPARAVGGVDDLVRMRLQQVKASEARTGVAGLRSGGAPAPPRPATSPARSRPKPAAPLVEREPGARRQASPSRRSGPRQRRDVDYRSIDAFEAQEIVDSLYRDGLKGNMLNRMLSGWKQLIEEHKAGNVQINCGNRDKPNQNLAEDNRREEFQNAVFNLVERREGRQWNEGSIGLKMEDACAYELAGFLVSDDCVMRQGVLDTRAELRDKIGQATVCGFVDKMLLCSKIDYDKYSDHRVLAYTLLDIIHNERVIAKLPDRREKWSSFEAQNFNDPETLTTPMVTVSKQTMTFYHGIFLSKMFELCETLLLENPDFGRNSSGNEMPFLLERNAYLDRTGGETFAQKIEKSGAYASQWAIKLFKLLFENKRVGMSTDLYSIFKNTLNEDQFDEGEKLAPVDRAYLAKFVTAVNESWISGCQILHACALLECKELFLEKPKTGPIRTFDYFKKRSALLPDDAYKIWRFQNQLGAFSAFFGKTEWYMSVAANYMGLTLPPLATGSVMTLAGTLVPYAVVKLMRFAYSGVSEEGEDMKETVREAVDEAVAAATEAAAKAAAAAASGMPFSTVGAAEAEAEAAQSTLELLTNTLTAFLPILAVPVALQASRMLYSYYGGMYGDYVEGLQYGYSGVAATAPHVRTLGQGMLGGGRGLLRGAYNVMGLAMLPVDFMLTGVDSLASIVTRRRGVVNKYSAAVVLAAAAYYCPEHTAWTQFWAMNRFDEFSYDLTGFRVFGTNMSDGSDIPAMPTGSVLTDNSTFLNATAATMATVLDETLTAGTAFVVGAVGKGIVQGAAEPLKDTADYVMDKIQERNEAIAAKEKADRESSERASRETAKEASKEGASEAIKESLGAASDAAYDGAYDGAQASDARIGVSMQSLVDTAADAIKFTMRTSAYTAAASPIVGAAYYALTTFRRNTRLPIDHTLPANIDVLE